MKILDLFFPRKCAFCGKAVCNKNTKFICDDCNQKLGFLSYADPLPPGSLHYVAQVYCPLIYSGNVKEALLRYKFRGENWLKIPFAEIIDSYLSFNNAYCNFDIITYVPISDSRFRTRGYNQSELIARIISQKTNIPLLNTMKRVSQGKVFTSRLNKDERLSMCRFQHIDNCKMIIGKRVLIIDDILTTGSTLDECAKILLQAGCAAVYGVVLASGRRDILREAI